jgi:guanosine-3',5'-bis(diphosphate) 3'-pyrophosphohydrolase
LAVVERVATLEDIKARLPWASPAALEEIERAFRFARRAHGDQRRASGEPFIEHPLAVARILAELELDPVTVTAALLHDVVEDTPVTLEEVRAAFGGEVADLVDGVTKLSRLQFHSAMEAQAENLRKMFLAMARDIRVILIKLADRLHNMQTLDSLDEARRRAVAQETLDIFAPVAHRLGIFRIKWQLEDLALKHLQPEVYRELAESIPRRREEREALAAVLMEELRRKLQEVRIPAEISGRAKHFYSIYQKMFRQGKDLSQIYDLVAIRVITETVKDCYGILGVVHALWKPIPGRFKDFIAMPKSNMYQSLHTTVVGPHGEPFEIQIRTREMHRTAEYGIAAHWRYKEGPGGDRDFDKKLAWLREILDWQRETKDPREFMESLKIDIFADEVFVFTPKGDVIELPAGSTPIDFAYRIHTEIGNHCVGAKVNGRITPLDRPLQNGDIVEILTHKEAHPSADWLQIVRTSSTKNRIRQWLKRERREEALERGQQALEREARRQGLDPAAVLRPEWLDEVRQRFSFQSADDLLASVGFGGASAAQVIGRLRELARRSQPPAPAGEGRGDGAAAGGARPRPAGGRREEGVRVRGLTGVLVRLPRCCNPVPGDPIIGYVTRGRGVTIHRTDCPNLQAHRAEEGRLVEVDWGAVNAAFYPVEVEIHGLDRPGLLFDVTQVVAEARTNILKASARGGARSGVAAIDLVLEVKDLQQVDHLLRRLRKVRDVFSAGRVIHHRADRDAPVPGRTSR